jgi:hypothetical protein
MDICLLRLRCPDRAMTEYDVVLRICMSAKLAMRCGLWPTRQRQRARAWNRQGDSEAGGFSYACGIGLWQAGEIS